MRLVDWLYHAKDKANNMWNWSPIKTQRPNSGEVYCPQYLTLRPPRLGWPQDSRGQTDEKVTSLYFSPKVPYPEYQKDLMVYKSWKSERSKISNLGTFYIQVLHELHAPSEKILWFSYNNVCIYRKKPQNPFWGGFWVFFWVFLGVFWLVFLLPPPVWNTVVSWK